MENGGSGIINVDEVEDGGDNDQEGERYFGILRPTER